MDGLSAAIRLTSDPTKSENGDAEVPAELEAMANAFYEKTKTGAERMYDGGFGGKGLDKLECYGEEAREARSQCRRR
jgi:hypothetical protein